MSEEHELLFQRMEELERSFARVEGHVEGRIDALVEQVQSLIRAIQGSDQEGNIGILGRVVVLETRADADLEVAREGRSEIHKRIDRLVDHKNEVHTDLREEARRIESDLLEEIRDTAARVERLISSGRTLALGVGIGSGLTGGGLGWLLAQFLGGI